MPEPHDCCAPQPTPSPGPSASSHPADRWWGVGAIAAAVLASACCWLPLLLIAVGASAAGFGAVFDRWRPFLLAVMAGLLAWGFWLAYRPQRCAPGSTCTTVPSGRRRGMRIALWVATGFALLIAAFPWYAVYVLPTAKPAAAGPTAADPQILTLAITGMTCEACTVQLQRDIAQVSGVHTVRITLATRQARIVWDGARTSSAALRPAVQAVITAAGYGVESDPTADP